MLKLTKIILFIILVLVVGGLVWKFFVLPEKEIAYTQDAKLCPDGSYVARIPPECDFALGETTANFSGRAFSKKI